MRVTTSRGRRPGPYQGLRLGPRGGALGSPSSPRPRPSPSCGPCPSSPADPGPDRGSGRPDPHPGQPAAPPSPRSDRAWRQADEIADMRFPSEWPPRTARAGWTRNRVSSVEPPGGVGRHFLDQRRGALWRVGFQGLTLETIDQASVRDRAVALSARRGRRLRSEIGQDRVRPPAGRQRPSTRCCQAYRGPSRDMGVDTAVQEDQGVRWSRE